MRDSLSSLFRILMKDLSWLKELGSGEFFPFENSPIVTPFTSWGENIYCIFLSSLIPLNEDLPLLLKWPFVQCPCT